MTTALSVNLNKVALVRNTRHLGIPSVTRAASLCLQAGAQGITVHPRPDARHIRPHDVIELAELLQDWPQCEFNVEGNPFHNLIDCVADLRRRGLPVHQVTFVPDSQDQFTSDHGWNLAQNTQALQTAIAHAHDLGLRVSLFMDADAAPMAQAKTLGADRIELYTEPYAAAWNTPTQNHQLTRFAAAAQAAHQAGLGINAGHDLNLHNLAAFVQHVPRVQEVSIGHALIADALELGYTATVHAYLRCLRAHVSTKA